MTDNITLYAKWGANGCSVTFDANGHGTAPTTQIIEYGQKASEPTALTAEGYTFGGWYTEKDCTTKYDFDSAVTDNITLYAKWTEGSSDIVSKGSVSAEVSSESEQVLNNSIPSDKLEEIKDKDIVFEFVTEGIDTGNENNLPEEIKNDIKNILVYSSDNSFSIGQVFDLSLFVKDKNTVEEYLQITSTNGEVKIKITIPESLQKEGRTFYLLRIHDGQVKIVGKGTGSSVEMATDAFSTYAIAYTDGNSVAAIHEELCEHKYDWIIERYPAEDKDGEMQYKCVKCGEVSARMPLSAYAYWNQAVCNSIKNAKQNAVVKVDTDRWISFHKSVFMELAERPDVTLEVSFLKEGYKGQKMTFSIPANTDAKALIGDDNFIGFLNLGSKFSLKESD